MNGALKKRCLAHPQNHGRLNCSVNLVHGNFIKVMQMLGHYDDVIKASVEKVGSTFMDLKS